MIAAISKWWADFKADHNKHWRLTIVEVLGEKYRGPKSNHYVEHAWTQTVKCRLCGKVWERPYSGLRGNKL